MQPGHFRLPLAFSRQPILLNAIDRRLSSLDECLGCLCFRPRFFDLLDRHGTRRSQDQRPLQTLLRETRSDFGLRQLRPRFLDGLHPGFDLGGNCLFFGLNFRQEGRAMRTHCSAVSPSLLDRAQDRLAIQDDQHVPLHGLSPHLQIRLDDAPLDDGRDARRGCHHLQAGL